MQHQEITKAIIGCAFEVSNELGSGFLESVYEKAMCIALRQKGLTVYAQHPIQVFFRGICVGNFDADLLVEGVVLVELKAAKDLYLILPPTAGGQAKIDSDGYVSGPPTLVCEIAASSVSIDLHYKLNAYRRNGVKEYLVWRTEDAAIDWFVLNEGQFLPIAPEADGTLRSRSFPGLWLLPSALLNGDLATLFALLDRAAATPEHTEFMDMLKRSTQPA